jgi:hypothetical protein
MPLNPLHSDCARPGKGAAAVPDGCMQERGSGRCAKELVISPLARGRERGPLWGRLRLPSRRGRRSYRESALFPVCGRPALGAMALGFGLRCLTHFRMNPGFRPAGRASFGIAPKEAKRSSPAARPCALRGVPSLRRRSRVRRDGPSLAWRALSGIHAAQPLAQRLRSAGQRAAAVPDGCMQEQGSGRCAKELVISLLARVRERGGERAAFWAGCACLRGEGAAPTRLRGSTFSDCFLLCRRRGGLVWYYSGLLATQSTSGQSWRRATRRAATNKKSERRLI